MTRKTKRPHIGLSGGGSMASQVPPDALNYILNYNNLKWLMKGGFSIDFSAYVGRDRFIHYAVNLIDLHGRCVWRADNAPHHVFTDHPYPDHIHPNGSKNYVRPFRFTNSSEFIEKIFLDLTSVLKQYGQSIDVIESYYRSDDSIDPFSDDDLEEDHAHPG